MIGDSNSIEFQINEFGWVAPAAALATVVAFHRFTFVASLILLLLLLLLLHDPPLTCQLSLARVPHTRL